MYKRILVPLDGSEMAEQALSHAQAQAECFQTELVLMYVTEPLSSSFVGIAQVQEKTRDWALEYLNQIAGRISERGLQVSVVIAEGRAHEEITYYAETESINLIVLSNRGHSGLTRWMMGSIADRVVRGARVPVLVVRAPDNKYGPSKPEYRRILLPLDGSKLAEQAIPHALAQAECFQAELILIQVHEMILSARAVAVQAEHKIRSEAYDYLDRLAMLANRRGIQAESVIITGVPQHALLDYAESNQIDLIVLSKQGHSGDKRWMMGSVAERVARGANIPVLLVHARKSGGEPA